MSAQQEIIFNPLSHIGASYFAITANQKLSWLEIMGELIDNAWDAEANRVIIRFGPGKSVDIVDDGHGCDDIEKMLSLGVHYIPPGKKHRRIGRWGVGLKDAATWLWGITEITTCDGKNLIRGRIDWAKYTHQSDPSLRGFFIRSATPEDMIGTTIRFHNIDKRLPDIRSLVKEIGYVFSPGLQKGKQIIFIHNNQKETCGAWKLPAFDGGTVNETFDIKGRGVNLFAGVVRDGEPNEHKGYSLFYDNRIIKNTTTWANNGESLARFCATVELDHKWTLGKNKTEIKESEMDELEEVVYQRCLFLIERAKKKSESLKNNILNQEVSKLLQSNLEGKKLKSEEGKRVIERREKGEQTGTRDPKHTGRVRTPNKIQKKKGGPLAQIAIITFDWESGSPNGLLGRCDQGKRQCQIWLNENHPYLAYLKGVENAEAIAAICWVIAVEKNQTVDGNQFRLISRGETVIDSLSQVLVGYDNATAKERDAI